MSDLLILAFIALATGRGTINFAELLDTAMDYQNILWKIRYKCVRGSISDNALRLRFDAKFNEVDTVGADHRINFIHTLYLEYAEGYSRGILCPKCFGFYFLLLFLGIEYFTMFSDFDISYMIVFYLTALIGYIK